MGGKMVEIPFFGGSMDGLVYPFLPKKVPPFMQFVMQTKPKPIYQVYRFVRHLQRFEHDGAYRSAQRVSDNEAVRPVQYAELADGRLTVWTPVSQLEGK